ncbi:peptidoglycan DD-metalloendopeptidase family protein [Streptomyces triculaminicus]|uniref:Peptidoglycan DD-metalloendopeptidase family protein n=2 Tax=Streptomyces TaxID=1883 RepID=A0A939FL20_9ACTN|nr:MULTISPECIES: M23 family metallopeptidase [Streptomyces]MBO0652684.1 peptidoglycan DD-metalloendopeptidase family protein [Streptomyces triculaminicus]QSY51744.1 peptidoglycan DD-metalloendopeptidase family protein [Streptomyces griseocarneus]
MSKRTAFRNSSKAVLRTRAAVVAAGLGASVALGSGVALAADTTATVSEFPAFASVASLGDSLNTQAATQLKVAEKEKQAAEQAKRDAAKRADEVRKQAEASRKRADGWVAPVAGYQIGQPFGKAGSMWAHKHSGQDLVVGTGTSVMAVHGGTVVKAGPNGGGDGPAYGNAIVIKHDDNTYSQYAHLSQVKVSVGQTVTTGQVIGLSGSTGNSSGPHLHFEIRTTPNYGSGIEPVGFMKAHGENL